MGLTKSSGNMYEWCSHMHAHIKGACEHKCVYCYAPKGCQDRQDTYSGPAYLDENELEVSYAPQKGEKPRTIFIDHMNDLWSESMRAGDINRVLRHCGQYLMNGYVFQTKNPQRYMEFINELNVLRRWSNGVLLGCTVETNRPLTNISMAPHPLNRLVAMTNLHRSTMLPTFITVEPILDCDPDALADWICLASPQFVNIGADSKHCSLPEPSADKVMRLIKRLQEAGIEIREKRNLDRILNPAGPNGDGYQG